MAQVPAGESLDHLLQVLKSSQASSISTQCSCWVKGVHGIEGVELEDFFFGVKMIALRYECPSHRVQVFWRSLYAKSIVQEDMLR